MWNVRFEHSNGAVFSLEKIIRTDEELITVALKYLVEEEIYPFNGEKLIATHVLREDVMSSTSATYGVRFVGDKDGKKLTCLVGINEWDGELVMGNIYPSIKGFINERIMRNATGSEWMLVDESSLVKREPIEQAQPRSNGATSFSITADDR